MSETSACEVCQPCCARAGARVCMGGEKGPINGLRGELSVSAMCVGFTFIPRVRFFRFLYPLDTGNLPIAVYSIESG